MIIINDSMSKDIIKQIIENEKTELNRKLQLFNFQKKILISYTENITETLEKIEYFEDTQKITYILSNFKTLFDKIHLIEKNFPDTINLLEVPVVNSSKTSYTIMTNNYNQYLLTLQKNLDSFSEELSKFVDEIKEFIEFKFIDKITYEEKSISESLANSQHTKDINNNQASITENTEILNTCENNILSNTKDNNCLLISETQKKVYLPYKINKLNNKLTNSKYSNVSEIIENEYILPLRKFKNPILSRFNETYHLMRFKEKSTFLEALDLAIELSFNSNLNPAVISACENKTELDIYLDCLYENELEKFTIFEIKYEIPPVIKK